MFSVDLATVQPGATAFREGNVNDTYKGLIRTTSGLKSAVIKDLDQKQLANELLVATLAKDHGLPVPDCYLAAVPSGTIAATKGPKLPSGERLTFASADVGSLPPLDQFRRQALSPDRKRANFCPMTMRWRLSNFWSIGSLMYPNLLAMH